SPYFHPIGEQPPALQYVTVSGFRATRSAITPCLKTQTSQWHSVWLQPENVSIDQRSAVRFAAVVSRQSTVSGKLGLKIAF
ncbi:hypothetical protein, partial [Mesorhizobium sp. M0768]|uniref:hypothetical protein n=1 Tax=Mesorhizobium sp. M0768 TaxID=2956996 RepID=UPI00333BA138